ncbi:MAG: LamG domain-containing protein [Sedimentisphaerales bacterium]|nr:LamG domain-containing protein [Sedimentisphaerales bacterium]
MRKITMFILIFIFCASSYGALVSHWSLDEDEYVSGQHEDIYGSNDATVNGTPVFVDGVSGIEETAVDITPSSGWASTSDFTLTTSNEFTISIWSKWQGSQTEDTNNLSVVSAMGGTSNLGDATGSVGNWRHLCITYDGLQGRIYLNGQEVYEEYWPKVDLDDLYTQIGHNEGSAFFNGSLDEIRLYNSALNGTQVTALYTRSVDCILSYDSSEDTTGPLGVPDCLVNFYDYTAVTDLEELAGLAEGWLSCGLDPDCD